MFATILYRGVLSVRLSVCLSVCLSVRPSVRWLTFCRIEVRNPAHTIEASIIRTLIVLQNVETLRGSGCTTSNRKKIYAERAKIFQTFLRLIFYYFFLAESTSALGFVERNRLFVCRSLQETMNLRARTSASLSLLKSS